MFGRDKNDQHDSQHAANGHASGTDNGQGFTNNRSTVVPISTPADTTTQDATLGSQGAPVLNEDSAGSDYIMTNSGPSSVDSPVPPASNGTAQSSGDAQSVSQAGQSDPGSTIPVSSEPTISSDAPITETPSSEPLSLPEPSVASAPSPAALNLDVPADLQDIKQQALKQLSPLVNHLDQTPEDRFRTTMMMLQATDDQSLIKIAYEAAQGINDEKARAQALLDVVNEINYFTQQGPK